MTYMTPINPQMAVAAVFRTLYENNRNIQSVICDFVFLNFIDWGQVDFSAREISQYLHDKSGFDVPQAVIQEALIGQGRKYFNYDKRAKRFSLNPELSEDTRNGLEQVLAETKEQNAMAVTAIAAYVAKKLGVSLDEVDQVDLGNALSRYLRGCEDVKYSEHIAEYLIENGANSEVVRQIQSIKEGNVFLEGLSQEIVTDKVKDNFNIPLTLYLETEIIFHIVGLNGDEYARIGSDFINTVNEINAKSENGRPIVILRYFPETEDEIHRYFAGAEEIVERGLISRDSGTAMRTIVNKCEHKYEVEALKDQIFKQLNDYGISVDPDTNYRPYEADTMALNIEDWDEVKKIEDECEERWDENQIKDALQLLNFIHVKRADIRRDRGYLKIRHLLISGKGVTFASANSISHDPKVKSPKGAPLVTSIEGITNLLWLALNKRLMGGNGLLSSMDVISHAQVYISRKLNSKLGGFYKQLDDEVKSGNFDNGETPVLMNRLYVSEQTPEQVTSANLDSITHLLSLKSLDDYREMIKAEHQQHDALVTDNDKMKNLVAETQAQLDEQSKANADLQSANETMAEKMKAQERTIAAQKSIIDQIEVEKRQKAEAENRRKRKRRKRLRLVGRVFAWTLIVGFFILLVGILWDRANDPGFSWKDWVRELGVGVIASLLGTSILWLINRDKGPHDVDYTNS